MKAGFFVFISSLPPAFILDENRRLPIPGMGRL
jgi:hypothetical protein